MSDKRAQHTTYTWLRGLPFRCGACADAPESLSQDIVFKNHFDTPWLAEVTAHLEGSHRQTYDELR